MFQQTAAETTTYMVMGFGVIFTTILLHLISLFVRSRRLKVDLQTLEDLDKE